MVPANGAARRGGRRRWRRLQRQYRLAFRQPRRRGLRGCIRARGAASAGGVRAGRAAHLVWLRRCSRCPSASCGAVRGLPPAAGSAAAGAAAVGAAAAGAAEVGAAAVGAAAAGAAAAGAAAGGAAAGAPGCESRVVGSAKALCAWQRAGHTHAARRTRRRARPPRLSRSECLPTGRRHGAGAVRCARVARPRSVDRVSFRFPRPRETLRHVPWAVRCPRVMGADRCLRTASHAG
mmetsp:Transcript_59825/g.163964  ORF Transcript_59825/g.163964 Transcript_59825/m.163964 type:complete len:235 (+) Transcript_59825:633-1337(+)